MASAGLAPLLPPPPAGAGRAAAAAAAAATAAGTGTAATAATGGAGTGGGGTAAVAADEAASVEARAVASTAAATATAGAAPTTGAASTAGTASTAVDSPAAAASSTAAPSSNAGLAGWSSSASLRSAAAVDRTEKFVEDEEQEDGEWDQDEEPEEAPLVGDDLRPRPRTRGRRESSTTTAWARAASVLWSLLWVAMWYGLSTCLSLFNKWFLGKSQYGFEYPLLLTSAHFFLQFAFSALSLWLFCQHFRPARPVTWREYGARVVPSGLATALDIGLSNYSLVFLTLSFYTMCKASAPVFLLAFAFLFGLERLAWQLVAVIAVVTAGLVLTVYGESQFDAVGFMLVMSASVMAGLRWTLTQILLQKRQLGIDNPFATLYFITPVMGVTLATIGMFIEEWWTLPSSSHFATAQVAFTTLGLILASSLLAFFMVLSEFQLIRATSAMTFVVAGIFKEFVTVLVSHAIFGDQFGPANIAGLVIVVVGVAAYNVHKYRTVVLNGEGPPPGVLDDAGDDDRARRQSFRLRPLGRRRKS